MLWAFHGFQQSHLRRTDLSCDSLKPRFVPSVALMEKAPTLLRSRYNLGTAANAIKKTFGNNQLSATGAKQARGRVDSIPGQQSAEQREEVRLSTGTRRAHRGLTRGGDSTAVSEQPPTHTLIHEHAHIQTPPHLHTIYSHTQNTHTTHSHTHTSHIPHTQTYHARTYTHHTLTHLTLTRTTRSHPRTCLTFIHSHILTHLTQIHTPHIHTSHTPNTHAHNLTRLHILTHTHALSHILIRTLKHTHSHKYVHTFIYPHLCIHQHLYIYSHTLSYTHIHTHFHTLTHQTLLHAYTLSLLPTHICSYTFTHT